MKCLTEREAAEFLGCLPSKVQRLRLSGALPYIPGRPVLIAETDLNEYLDGLKRKAMLASPEARLKQQATAASAREWALKAKLLRR